MRHWLLILMIVLIPLRGWNGDAMALAADDAPVGSTAPCHGVAELAQAMSSGHHSETTVVSNMAHGDVEKGVAQHSNCTVCDLCNGPALAQPTHSARSTRPVCIHTAPASERFASAVPQRGTKPPIA